MRIHTLVIAAALLGLGCGEKDTTSDDSEPGGDDTSPGGDDSDPGTDDTGEPAGLPDNELTGYLELTDGSVRGDIAVAKAFSFYSSTYTFVYVASNPDATCDMIAELFDPRGEAVDKGDLFLPGHCNLSYSIPGGPSATEIDVGDGGGTMATECAFGDGAWEWRSDVSFPDYYWSGEYFNAGAYIGTFSVDLYQQGANHLVVNTAIRGWRGTFPYSEDPERSGEHLARGSANGVIYAEHCPGLEDSGLF